MPHIDRPGVLTATQVLSATIPKPALLPWAVKLAVEDLAERLMARHDPVHPSRSIVSEGDKTLAKKAHIRASERARNIGSAAHELIDEYLKMTMAGTEADLQPPPDAAPAFQALGPEDRQRVSKLFGYWCGWFIQSGITPEHRELDLWEPGASLAGSCDLVGLCADRKRAVIDWKFSKAVYAESWFQLGIYALLLERRGIIVERLMVVVTNDEGVTVETSDRVDEAKRCAQALFESASWLTKEKDPWKKRK